jgi:hypothetical protein
MHGEIYCDIYEDKFDWGVEPFLIRHAFRLPAQVIHFL